MYVIINLMHLVSQISGSQHSNGLLLDFDYSYTNCKYILNMISIRSYPRNVGHDLDIKNYSKWYIILYNVCFHEFYVFCKTNK